MYTFTTNFPFRCSPSMRNRSDADHEVVQERKGGEMLLDELRQDLLVAFEYLAMLKIALPPSSFRSEATCLLKDPHLCFQILVNRSLNQYKLLQERGQLVPGLQEQLVQSLRNTYQWLLIISFFFSF